VDATEKTKYFAHIGKKSRFLIAQNFWNWSVFTGNGFF
jgi:hypothetical protein